MEGSKLPAPSEIEKGGREGVPRSLTKKRKIRGKSGEKKRGKVLFLWKRTAGKKKGKGCSAESSWLRRRRKEKEKVDILFSYPGRKRRGKPRRQSFQGEGSLNSEKGGDYQKALLRKKIYLSRRRNKKVFRGKGGLPS